MRSQDLPPGSTSTGGWTPSEPVLAYGTGDVTASYGGELAAAVEAGVVAHDDVTELGALLVGEADGRRSARDITLFDSTGLAIQELAIAKVPLAKADGLDLPALDL
jgi:Ornithine cyclodeaminase/mu-crystallin family